MTKVSLTEARRLVAKADHEKAKADERKSREAAEKLVGKCFKFWNGGGDEHWWLYVRILSVVSNWQYSSRLRAAKIQAAPSIGLYGISVEVNDLLDAQQGKLSGGYIPITVEEYERETKKILSRLGLKRA